MFLKNGRNTKLINDVQMGSHVAQLDFQLSRPITMCTVVKDEMKVTILF